jgi:hypothetical protein
VVASAIQRNDDVIRAQLRIVDHLFRPAHSAERDVDATENVVPMRHRLRAEDFVENGRQPGTRLKPHLPGSFDRKVRELRAAQRGLD